MTATGKADSASDGTKGGATQGATDRVFDSAGDHAYFLALEDLFIGLRGAPLLLSPGDWQVAKEWRRRGIPLELVRRVLHEVFERRKERGADDVVTLRYFRRPVQAAWKKARELAAGGERAEPEAFDLTGRLHRLAEALPEELAERPGWVARIEALAGTTGDDVAGEASDDEPDMPDMEAVEAELGHLDGELLTAAAEALPEAVAGELEREAERALARWQGRLPEEEALRSHAHLYRRLLRERIRLPVLSLFSPEAEAVEDEGGAAVEEGDGQDGPDGRHGRSEGQGPYGRGE
jgi:hypothetical protein